MMSGPTSSQAAVAGDSRPHGAVAASPEGEASSSRHQHKGGQAVGATIWRTTLLVWIPQTAIWYVVASVYPGYTPHDIFVTPAMALIVGCILGPYIETHLLRFVLYLLRKGLGDNPRVIWYSALFWGVMHVQSSTWGLHAIWAFYIFTRCYLEQSKYSIRRAVWVTTAVHAACNLISYIATLLWKSTG